MPSTQTRTKLKAFQFVEGAPSVDSVKEREAEKENIHAAPGKGSKLVGTPKTSRVVKDVGNVNKTPKPPTVTDCPPPSTPATTRLPLADLVGNVDDSSRHVPPPAASPEEQLIWRGSQAVNTPLPRKNKKRARSSSPVPSQDESRLDPNKQDMTTPQADPAMELWSRYTNSKGTPTANKSAAFAHLINESSPRSAAAAGSVSGLRRWASCGVEFPASNRKKRRMHGVFQAEQAAEDVFADPPSSDGMLLGQQAKPNLASIVQRMRECVSKSESHPPSQLPSSSSPLPRTGGCQGTSSGSPLQRRTRDQNVDALETSQHDLPPLDDDLDEDGELVQDEEHAKVEPSVPGPLQTSPGSSDDFGDDDFDADLVEALDVTPQEVDQPVLSTSHATISHQSPNVPPQQHTTAVPSKLGSDDEFGMDDEDDFAADLEQVASLYDTRSLEPQTADPVPTADKSLSAAPVDTSSATIINLVDDDDDFGEDIDADEFAAAEVAATQLPTNIVCKTHTFLKKEPH